MFNSGREWLHVNNDNVAHHYIKMVKTIHFELIENLRAIK